MEDFILKLLDKGLFITLVRVPGESTVTVIVKNCPYGNTAPTNLRFEHKINIDLFSHVVPEGKRAFFKNLYTEIAKHFNL